MSPPQHTPEDRPPPFWLAVAGLEAGLLGGLAALVYLWLDGFVRGANPWMLPNLLGATLTAGSVRSSFGWTTLIGISIHLTQSALAGVLFAPLLGRLLRWPRLCRAAGLILALGWYYFSYRIVWTEWNPRLVLHQPFPATILAHVIFGFCLGLLPYIVRELGPFNGQRAPDGPSGASRPAPF